MISNCYTNIFSVNTSSNLVLVAIEFIETCVIQNKTCISSDS